MITQVRTGRVRTWIAGVVARVSPTPIHDRGAGVLVRPTLFDVQAYDIGSRWQCWPLPNETPAAHRHRLQLHLTTLQLAIEDDLAAILGERS